MAWVAIFDGMTGRLVSLGDRLGEQPPEHLEIVELDEPPDLRRFMWSETERGFVPRPEPQRQRTTQEIFAGQPEIAALPQDIREIVLEAFRRSEQEARRE